MVDGFKYSKKAFRTQKAYTEEIEYKRTVKELRNITRKYSRGVLGTSTPRIKNTLSDRTGAWANVVVLPSGSAEVVTRAKKIGGHVSVAMCVFVTASKLLAPIIVYLPIPRGNKPYVFYRFSPVMIEEDVSNPKGTCLEDGRVLFRLQLGTHVPVQEQEQ